MVKEAFTNFYKRLKYIFIPMGVMILGFLVSALVFIGGAQLVLSVHGEDLIMEVERYFLDLAHNIKFKEIIDLSILGKIYKDIISMAGTDSQSVKTGLTILAIVTVLIFYGSYKGSIAIVNYITKRKFFDEETKHGFVSIIVKFLIGLAFSAGAIVWLSVWTWSPLLVLAIYLIVDAIELIVEIHYVFYSNIKFKEFIKNAKTQEVFGVFVVSQLAVLILTGLFWFLSPIITFVLALPLLAYNETNIRYTVVSYYKNN